jgi:hypothetical protein
LPDGIFSIPIWVNFVRSCNGKCWYVYQFYGHSVYISPFGMLCRQKNLATLLWCF